MIRKITFFATYPNGTTEYIGTLVKPKRGQPFETIFEDPAPVCDF